MCDFYAQLELTEHKNLNIKCGIAKRHIFILLVHILFIFTLYEIKEKPVLFIVPSVPAVIAAAVILYRI
jgi:hypothetical protein